MENMHETLLKDTAPGWLSQGKAPVKESQSCLARWLSWLEHCPVHQKGSIPSQGTFLGCGFDPWLHGSGGNQSMEMFLSVSVSPPSSLSKINKYILG